MGIFIMGFISGFATLAVGAWLFIAWAIAGAEKSICEDIEQMENDNL